MGQVARVTGFLDGLQDGWVVEFLGIIQLVSTGVTRRVVKADQRMERSQGTDDIALHDLHMVNVVEEFYPRGAYRMAHARAPGGMVGLVVRVIDLAVQ